MRNQFDFRRLLPHLLAIIGFLALAIMYMSPVLKGQQLAMGDVDRFIALQSEIRKYASEYIGWTNSLFGGMPTFLVGGDYSNGIFIKIHGLIYTLFNIKATFIGMYLIGAYLMLRGFRCDLWTSILGAIGYAFFTYNFQIIEAGHTAKVYAVAYLPLMAAGVIFGFNQRPWLGAVLLSLGLGLQIHANHPQITYYSAIVLGILAIFETIRAVKNGAVKSLIIFFGASAIFCALALATNTSRLWTLYDHSKETIRGGSELTPVKGEAASTGNSDSKGLTKDYAFAWSYGKLESLTLLIPDFSGGSSGGELDTKSESYKTLTRYGVDGQNAAQFAYQLPTYWGDQTFVGGGVYSGAIICFLFVLGLFYAEKRYRIPFLIAGIFTLMLGWGGNFTALNYFLFDYIPGFNKFRSVSMILSLTQFCMIIIASLGVKQLIENRPSWEEFKKPFFISLGSTAGLALILAIVPSLVGLRSDNDAAFVEQMAQSFGNNKAAANDLYNALLDDRASMLRSDALRTVLFILLAAAVLWAFITNKLKNTTAVVGIISALTLIDMWSVNKRYLNNDDFRPKFESAQNVEPNAADQQILRDTDPDYRVLDVTSNPFADPRASAFHKSVGGYSASKLRRTQDLIERQMVKNNMAVFNMLNTKYFIVPDEKKQPVVQQNPGALGNAWFVRELKMVNNPDEEMAALDNFNPGKTAVVDKRFADILKGAQPSADSTGTIRLTNYHPTKLAYESNTSSPQIAVFSEMYYKGNEDWKSYIDGKETPHFRADYVLRAMVIPAGKHTIEFKFDAKTVSQGQKIDLYASIAWLLLIGGALFLDFRTKKQA
ncbi:hypothetical protein FHS57_001349 [Runella defluvii]|uniref:YfhO family protein n=1 Tax=Runella defluvii TaxID=370973 RepID=A0A7W5ZIN6_9BACT|nr:hypothetical protein [Runella defluvii]MBB3837355.1 hypothetical protein [Runella defluvii]